MRNRSPALVVVFTIITLFMIYPIYWLVSTKNEMNEQGAEIPTAWLLIVPIANWWWLWKYSQGVDQVTKGRLSAGVSFILLFLISIVGMPVIQSTFNQTFNQSAAA